LTDKLGEFLSHSSIALAKYLFHFNASHMIFTPQYNEGIHGHSYNISIEIYGDPDDSGMIIDFILLENILKESITEWDHYVLMPKDNPKVTIIENGSNFDIQYGDRFYSIPQSDIILFEGINITTENLAKFLAKKIQFILEKVKPSIKFSKLKVEVWETPIYCASYTIHHKPN